MSQQPSERKAEVSIGFGADPSGAGLAYAAVHLDDRTSLLRVPFRIRRAPSSQGREIAYGALRAVANLVRERHPGDVRFSVADESLAADLAERRQLPTSLTIPYVALRCALNRFGQVDVAYAKTPEIGDLTARAVAEVSLHVAA